MDKRPALARAPVAGLHIRILRFHGEAKIDGEMKQGFILKVDGNRVIFAGGIDFGVVNRLALNFFKAMKLAVTIAADCGLTALDDLGFGDTRGPSSFSRFLFGRKFRFGCGFCFG